MNDELEKAFEEFVEFCRKHGHALANHKEFGVRAREIRELITETCEWVHYPRTNDYQSGCGEVWTYSLFAPGGESTHKFCTHCGRRIVIAESKGE